jgi:hypothetical protein
MPIPQGAEVFRMPYVFDIRKLSGKVEANLLGIIRGGIV